MKAAKIIQIVCWSLLVVILVAVIVFAIARDNGAIFIPKPEIRLGDWDLFGDERGSGRRYEGGTYSVPTSGIKNICVEWVSGKVNIIPYSGSEISFTEACRSTLDEKDKLVYEVRGDTLVIKFRKSGFTISFGRSSRSKDLSLSIPEQLASSLDGLDINTVSADIISNGLITGSAELETVSGDIRLSDYEADELRVSTVSGIMEIEGKFDSIDANSVSGRIKIRTPVCPSEVDIGTVTGDAEIEIPENDGFEVEFEKISGSFECDFQIAMTKNGGIYKDGGASFDMNTASGDLIIRKQP